MDLAAAPPCIWLIDFERSAERLEALAPGLVDAGTLAGIMVGQSAEVRRRRLASHAALRLVLAQGFGREIASRPLARTPAGRPHIPGLAGDFSLAHTQRHALIALSRNKPIGVDLEEPRTVAFDERRRARLVEAACRLPGATSLPSTALLNAWVRLEAFAKADGRGMGRLMTAIGIIGGAKDRPLDAAMEEWIAAAPQALVHDLELPVAGAVAALAFAPASTVPPIETLDAARIDALAAAFRSP